MDTTTDKHRGEDPRSFDAGSRQAGQGPPDQDRPDHGPPDCVPRPTGGTPPGTGRLAGWIAGVWSLAYLVLGVLWAAGGPGYPFAGAQTLAPATSLLDNTPTTVTGLILAGIAVGTGILTLRLVRGRRDLTTSVLAVALGLVLAIVLTDVRILMTLGYLPVMLVALVTGSLEAETLAAMANWPAANLLLMMVAGISLASLGGSTLIDRVRQTDPRQVLRVGQAAVAVAVAVPVVYATTRLGWLLGIPVGISRDFLAYIAQITPIGAGLATLGLIGAALTVGLVRPWGEVWPRWVPVLRGREIPARGPAYAALAVAVPIAAAGLMYVRLMLAGQEIGPEGAAGEVGAWLPEMLWPLWAAALAVAALTYLVRRRSGLFWTERR